MRVEVVYKSPLLDGRAVQTSASLRHAVGGSIAGVYLADVYLFEGIPELEPDLAGRLFCDSVAQEVFVDDPRALWNKFPEAAVAVEVSSRPGVTDPVAMTARRVIEADLGHPLRADAVVQSARLTLVELQKGVGREASDQRARVVAEQVAAALHNPLIEKAVLLSREEWNGGKRLPPFYPFRVAPSPTEVQRFDLAVLTEEELSELSRTRLLALDMKEMLAVRAYFEDPEVLLHRRHCGLDERATDVELEMIAQTWSEHCKHKIFNATIRYTEQGRSETIDSLFHTYIKRTTDELAPRRPFLRSLFHDNSGVVSFDEDHLICFKVETHNSPSALDPYGGAITGIVGVNRDILGTGKGAKPIFNTDVLCFGHPDTEESEVAEGLLHPARVLHGVHRGIVDGGNQSGIPVVAGAFLFDRSYLGKPLVFCGTGGILPAEIGGEAAWIKHIDPGDLAVVVGGRVGKDGIHGATFSSLALDEASPTSAVQIGDPITQKRMSDFLLEARDRILFKGITDNGAGGLSSSLGEMAELAGGVRIDLDACPLKYPGLAPWEILVSESQERMSLAVDPATVDELLELATRRDVEATVVGRFDDSGMVQIRYRGEITGLLSLEFLHHGLPRMELIAEWNGPAPRSFSPPVGRTAGGPPDSDSDARRTLLQVLADPNIASKETLIRQYDHEVQGASVIKPFVGEHSDGPSDGAVLRPVSGSTRGVTVTHGICPAYGDIDPYDMAMCAVDEAFRAHVALGGNPQLAAALDNFCWPDPVQSVRTPDGYYKLAQLVRACRGLRDACLAYGLPLISGKDSMKNDADVGGRRLSIRPTLLVSLMGIIDDVRTAVSTDFKRSGDSLYLLGTTRGELGGSAYERLVARDLGRAPRLSPAEARACYEAYHRAVGEGLVSSCHDLAEGGLAVALAESAFAGRLGADVTLDAVELTGIATEGRHRAATEPRAVADAQTAPPVPAAERLLFCESPSRLLVTVPLGKEPRFEHHFRSRSLLRLGIITREPRLTVRLHGREVLSLDLEAIGRAWQGIPW